MSEPERHDTLETVLSRYRAALAAIEPLARDPQASWGIVLEAPDAIQPVLTCLLPEGSLTVYKIDGSFDGMLAWKGLVAHLDSAVARSYFELGRARLAEDKNLV